MYMHGHVREFRNYQILETVIVSNLPGYGDENAVSYPAVVVEI